MTTESPQPTPVTGSTVPAEAPQPNTLASAPPRGRGRLVVLAAALALSAVGVGGGVGLLVLHGETQAAPVAAATGQPTPTPSYGAMSNGNHFGDLGDLLLPVPSSLYPGPDDPGVGNDAVLTAAQYHGIYDKDLKSLSAGDRQGMESYFVASHIKGGAVRTYRSGGTLSVEISLLQENQQFAAQLGGFSSALAAKTGVYRTGPAVPGFPTAHCYLPPLLSGDKLDYMECDASVGDMYVHLGASGVAPLDTATAVDLMRQQLTRLAIPGAQI
ncbi:hypothetical protein [Streptacidiphilus sp. EB129]|uniref:hypothetical protein n=1 Tax=Streptacidiphilus sp. EB129 TaxID=3156262 RepID=UPI003517A4F0